jgi:pilus assembly protein CpaC
MNKGLATVLAVGLLFTSSAASAQRHRDGDGKIQKNEEMTLVVGENKTINALGVKNYSEGAPGIAEIHLSTDGSKFVIVGRKPGSTTLLLINKDGTTTNWSISVFRRSPDAVKHEVEQLLQATPGVTVRRVGSRFFIEGGVQTQAEAERIQRIAALYPGQVESLVTAGGGAANQAINIRVDFFFVQYDKNYGYQVGLDWPAQVGSVSLDNEVHFDLAAGTNTTTATASIVNQALPALDLAAQRGWAKVLKQSTVITVNGSSATFENGGEQNYPISAGLTASIQSITYGTTVTVLPRLDPKSGDLEVKLDADVSDLTPPVTGTTLPGRETSKLDTLVRLKLGQSLVLSGIRARSQRHSITGLPFLSDIPLLGVFFGSHQDQAEDTEGAVFIIPTAVESVSKPAIQMVNDAMSQYEGYSGDLTTVDAYEKQPAAWRRAP